MSHFPTDHLLTRMVIDTGNRRDSGKKIVQSCKIETNMKIKTRKFTSVSMVQERKSIQFLSSSLNAEDKLIIKHRWSILSIPGRYEGYSFYMKRRHLFSVSSLE